MSSKKHYRKNKNTIIDYLIYMLFMFICIGGISIFILKFFRSVLNEPPASTNNPSQSSDGKTEDTTHGGDIPDDSHVRPAANIDDIPDGVYFATDDVNIRSNASTSSKALGILYKYHYVKVISRQNGWAKIEYDDGYAYIYDEYLTDDAGYRQKAVAYHQECADDKLACSNIVDKSKALYTYTEMVSDLKELKEKYPNCFDYWSIGTTVDGRDIYATTIGDKNAPNQIVVHANIHAREYMTVLLAMSQIEYFLDNYNYSYSDEHTYKDLFSQYCLYYIPTLNPDGMSLAQFGLDGINNAGVRNKVYMMLGTGDHTLWKSNLNGVDLNKQFPTGFRNDIMSNMPGYQNYPGKTALSEAEAEALYNLVNTLPNLKLFIAYHSTGEDIYWDSGAGEVSGDLYRLSKSLAKIFSDYSGYTLQPEFTQHNGFDTDYITIEKKAPAFTIETGNVNCPLPIEQFYAIWRDNKLIIPLAIEYLMNQ